MISRFLFVTDWALRGILHKVDADSGHFIVGNYKTRGRLMGIVAYDQSRQPPGMVPHQLSDQSTEDRIITHVLIKWNGVFPEGQA